MLQTIHDKLKGWLAIVVLGAIGLVFIFWGINWTMTAPTYAAKVNGVEIPAAEVKQSYMQQLSQVQRQGNGAIDDLQRDLVKRQVLDEYVRREALLTRTNDLGYRVSDADVLASMAQVPAFQVDGKFNRDHALAIIKANGRSVGEVEEMFRRDAKLHQLDNALDASSFVTNTELKDLRALTFQQRELAWLTLSAEKYAAGVTPDDAAVKAYYDAHKAQYMSPETVNLHYVEIGLPQLEAKVKVDDAQLKSFYDEQLAKTPERFKQEEQRRVSHILLSVADPKEDAAVKTKAEGLLKRAQAGEDFAKLAKEFSQDPGSAAQGGDLGLSERKVYVSEFADAAWKMKEGEIAGPVKTQFGYHILKLNGIQPASTKTFEQAKSELVAEYKHGEAERLYNKVADDLQDAALQNADIETVARKAGLDVKDIPEYSRTAGGGDLGNVTAVSEAAFSQDVLDGRLSPIVEIEKGRGVILHATDHKLPQLKPLEAVRSEVLAALRRQRGGELAGAAAAEAKKRLDAGESWAVVAKSLNVPVQGPKFVSRSDQEVPLEVRTAAFGAPKPAAKPSYGEIQLPGGDAALYAFSALREDPTDKKPPEEQVRQQLAARMASGEREIYAAAARAAAKVSLNPQALD